ncbi:MAG: phosphoadenylyl-sulfate reductase [Pseudomonadota bacterium]
MPDGLDQGTGTRAAGLNARYADAPPERFLSDAIGRLFRGRIALVSSFGADSAVLLHMIAGIDRALPVLLLETGMLFAETLAYQRDLTRRLGLTDVRMIRPDPTDLAMLDRSGVLHRSNADGCCHLRKTLPLRRALAGFDATITGRKRGQSASRADLALADPDERSGTLRLNPLVTWSAGDIRAYIASHGLPPHPLIARGYPSIGCAPCTSPVSDGEDARAGRWRDEDKTECGIHFDGTRYIRGPGAGI